MGMRHLPANPSPTENTALVVKSAHGVPRNVACHRLSKHIPAYERNSEVNTAKDSRVRNLRRSSRKTRECTGPRSYFRGHRERGIVTKHARQDKCRGAAHRRMARGIFGMRRR